ncbi:MAG: class I SAM-dependent DNA methyltransferase [Armatimonadetes bacterium]|nr:class I SAM-dependent DNA methyltransferase [Armatimonadota bacterium]
MAQLENIEAIERRLWSAADQLRANSNHASNEYFLPVMGLVFLRHAYSRYLAVKDGIEAGLPSRGGVKRALTKEDFSQKSAIYLRPEAQFDTLVALPTGTNMAQAICKAMESIEADYESLKGVLPKKEYQELDDDVLRSLLRTLNPDELKKVSGDVFGRIYEYFLTQFAGQKAHDDGEFFTPISIVSFIANVLEPESGTVADLACGSGGMFVQSARVVEQHHMNPTERLTFRGLEKNATTINLAKMNLAVHGLEGDIQKAITYYEDPLDLRGKCDFVMANPPFNVDEVDADKVRKDPRLPFGLPGENKAKKVSNGNYLWISYFYSYLNETGRAGFVMSSQASSAGRDEAKVRAKLIESGAVDMMVAIRGNFFYTRTVPCELWFLNRAKPAEYQDKVLMLDARNVYRKVTRKIYDFSPEQLQNLLSIVWLYRGQSERFWDLVASHLSQAMEAATTCVRPGAEGAERLNDLFEALDDLRAAIAPLFEAQAPDGSHADVWAEYRAAIEHVLNSTDAIEGCLSESEHAVGDLPATGHHAAAEKVGKLADAARDAAKTADHAARLANRLTDLAEKELGAKASNLWANADVNRAKKLVEERRQIAVDRLKLVRYYHRQAHWLLERFPEGKLRDVEGLVKLVDRAELEQNDWSLTPGRYVGVAPEPEDEDFDFEEALRAIHEELQGLNDEAADLAATIDTNLAEIIA